MLHPQWRLHRALIEARSSGDPDLLKAWPSKALLALPDLEPPTFVIHGTTFGAGHLGNPAWADREVGFCVRGATDEVRALLESLEVDVLRGYVLFDRPSLAVSGAEIGLPRGAVLVQERFDGGHLIGFAPIELFRSVAYATEEEPWSPRVRGLLAL